MQPLSNYVNKIQIRIMRISTYQRLHDMIDEQRKRLDDVETNSDRVVTACRLLRQATSPLKQAFSVMSFLRVKGYVEQERAMHELISGYLDEAEAVIAWYRSGETLTAVGAMVERVGTGTYPDAATLT